MKIILIIPVVFKNSSGEGAKSLHSGKLFILTTDAALVGSDCVGRRKVGNGRSTLEKPGNYVPVALKNSSSEVAKRL